MTDHHLPPAKKLSFTFENEPILFKDLNLAYYLVKRALNDDATFRASKTIQLDAVFTKWPTDCVAKCNQKKLRNLAQEKREKPKSRDDDQITADSSAFENDSEEISKQNIRWANICPETECDRTFSTINARNLHLAWDHYQLPYKCTVTACDEEFVNEESLVEHQKWMHSAQSRLVCKHCAQALFSLVELRTHQLDHHEPVLIVQCGQPVVLSRAEAIKAHEPAQPPAFQTPVMYMCVFPSCDSKYCNYIRGHTLRHVQTKHLVPLKAARSNNNSPDIISTSPDDYVTMI